MFGNDNAISTTVIPEKRQALSGIHGSIQRRVLGAVALAASLLLVLGAALADDECGTQIDSGNPETITCAPGDYNDGITYSSDGDLTLQVTDDSDHLDVFETGIDVTGNGADDVFWDSSSFTSFDIRGSGIVLDYASGTGDIDINVGGEIVGQSDATHGIRAISGSGDVSVTMNGNIGSFNSGPAQYAIQAETGGLGTLDIVVGDSVNVDPDTGIAAIDATTGTGLLTIDIATGFLSTIRGQGGNAIRVDAGGDAEINVGANRTVTASFQSDEAILDLTAVGDITLNNAGSIDSSGPAIVAAGNTVTINNDGTIRGSIDLDLDGDYTFNNNAGALWEARLFGGGQTGDLGAGTFNNAGTIEMSSGEFISAPGTSFTGSGDSTLELRAGLGGRGQPDCTNPTVSGCLDLSGGSTSGQTAILINRSQPAAEPVNEGIVLVDVSGGNSAAEHFVLDPDSGTFAEDPIYGAIIDALGLFDYTLLYNPTTQQHILSSVPQREALEYVAMIHESLSVWHTTSDVVAGRQADLRDGGERGGWVRVFNDNAEHDAAPQVTTHGNTFIYDQRYDLNARGLIAGYDITADEDHVLGVHLGFMATRLEHDGSSTDDTTDFPSSVTFGTYAGWWNEAGLTLDGTINVNLLDIEHEVRDELETSRTNVLTAGIRGEAGWRFPVTESFYVQPLLTAAYAYADVEKLELRDYDAKFEDETSMRAALGVRLGGETQVSDERFSRIKYWLTARAWEEYAEDGNVQFQTDGDPLIIEDDISDTFEEVGLGVSFISPDEDLEVFLSGNVVSGDQVDSSNVTIGAKLRW